MQAQRVESHAGQGVRPGTQQALLFLAAWLVAALLASRAGWFERIPAVALFVGGFFVPGGAFAAAYFHSESFRGWVLTQDLRCVTLLQSLRLAGVIFLIEYARGTLPGVFALPTAFTDIFAGLTALIAGFTMVGPHGRRPTRGLLIWQWCGLGGLVISGTMGALTSLGPLGLLVEHGSSQAMAGWPLSLVPTFLGPLMLLLHMIALAILLERGRQEYHPHLVRTRPIRSD